MSPEGMAHAVDEYLASLRSQAATAEAIYQGRLEEGLEGILQLPPDVRLQIDQFIWDAAGGEPLDPAGTGAQELIAAAIMHSLEQRMGLNQ